MDNKQIYSLIKRIKQTQDGLDFIEYLKEMSKINYEEFKSCDSSHNDVVKGIAIAYDSLIKVFEKNTDNTIQKEDLEINAFT
jgi:hypothetical protein